MKKHELTCEDFKPTNKNGQKDKCFCAYLNRNVPRDNKFYKAFVKSLDRKTSKK